MSQIKEIIHQRIKYPFFYNKLIHNSTTKYEPSPYIPKLIKKMNDDNFMKITKYLAELTLNFGFSKKAKKFEKIFSVDLMLCSKCQIDGEDSVNFCGLLRKHEL